VIYFSVKNFADFQHYKDRSPPWIKLYNELLENYEFSCLQDASKMHLIAIWLLASRSDNRIPYDAEWIARKISATDPVNLRALVDAGFIIPDQPLQSMEQDASNALAESKQDARPERERETEERRGEKRERGAGAPPPKPKKIDLRIWELDSLGKQIIETEGLSPSDTMAKVRDWAANAGPKRLKTDPHAFLRNWCRAERERFALPGGLKRNGHSDPPDRAYLGTSNIPLAQAKAHAALIAKKSKLKPANLSEHEIQLLIAEQLVTEDQVNQWRAA
jgi:hypothetical protein